MADWLSSDFNGQEGTVCFWVQESLPDSFPMFIRFVATVGANVNAIYCKYDDLEKQLSAFYVAGGTSKFCVDTDFISTDYNFIGLTWSKSTGAGQLKYYLNGALQTTASDIGTWATDAPSSFLAKSGPGDFFINHLALWKVALNDGQIAAIYNASLAENASLIPELGATGARLRFINPTGGNLYLTSLQLRGKRIKAYKPVVCQAFDQDYVGKYGRPGITTMKFDMPYQNSEEDGRAFASYILNRYKNPTNALESITFTANKNSYLAEKAFKLKIGDRIHFTETQTGIDGSFFINGVEYLHDTDRLDVTLYLQPEDSVYWLIGTAGYSEIGETTSLGF